ncbi:2'-5' RNA ligase family protein [Dactylosporangium sucinum]|uniref:RNA 2',3'-cyclic phosphodiesterase n=1 Tax=Dactylosporangium sucinum TaxID=1424081 RepID=A0A917TA36_9ACTN|nr:2'-5' RNA ligase family protein [Dactylosporangium sucinum]GGM15562.1 RNA 2',3'-cyclic phosphodiesterase [Dactylosporangium sucinum]
MRLFIAAYPPEDVRAHFGAMVSRLAVARPMPPGRSTRLATPERWHITIAFLGDVPDEQADLAVELLHGLSAEPPTVRIAGGGRFGRGRFTTLLAKVREEAGGVGQEAGGVGRRGRLAEGGGSRLAALGHEVRRSLRRRRLPFDRKPLQPHVTIARPGDRLSAGELAADLAALDEYESPLWPVDELRLVRSFLGPNPAYEPLATVALSGPPGATA